MADARRTDRVIVESNSRDHDNDHNYDGKPVKRISWGAIIAGALTALAVLTLLNMLFYGIGISTINTASEQNPASGLPIGMLIATIISNLVALFVGGYVAGKLAGTPRTFPSIMHGILTWVLLTIFTFFLATSAVGSLVSGATSALSSAFSAASSGISSAAGAAPNSLQGATSALDQIPGLNVQQDVDNLLEQTGVQNPQQVGQQLTSTAVNTVQSGDSLTSQATQQEFTNIISQNSDLSQQEIQQQVQSFTQTAQQRVDQAQQQAAETAQTAANAVGTAAIIAFFVLLVGAAVAAAGSMLGSPKDAEEASGDDVRGARRA